MSATFVFFFVITGAVIFVTLLVALCALEMSARMDKESGQHESTAIIPRQLLANERRKFSRLDFPIACSDGSYAWFDRRKTALKQTVRLT